MPDNTYLVPPHRFHPMRPTPNQLAFILLPHFIVHWKSGAGEGQTTALLMSALQYVGYSGYNAIIFQRSDWRNHPKNIKNTAIQLLAASGEGRFLWDATNQSIIFPHDNGSKSTLYFDYLKTIDDIRRHAGTEYQFVGIDDADTIDVSYSRYLISRVRQSFNIYVPIRFRATIGHGNDLTAAYMSLLTGKEAFIDSYLLDTTIP